MTIGPRSTPEIVLHIGLMKTGTSYLQQVLTRNSKTLADAGVLVANTLPGARRAIHGSLADDHASLTQAWDDLAAQMRSYSGSTVVLSNELISFLAPATVRQVVESLQPMPVTIVVTARDLERVVPSAWQNKVKHGRSWSLESYVAAVSGRDAKPRGAARSFWHHHDLAGIASRWVAATSPDRVVVVCVPPTSAAPDELWRRFAAVLGIESSAYAADRDRGSNLSMGWPETELLREVNRAVRGVLDPSAQKRLVLRTLANEALRPDPSAEEPAAPVRLDASHRRWAREKSIELLEATRALGVRFEGDPNDLVPAEVSAEQTDELAGQEVVPLPSPGTVRAIVRLLLRIADLESTRPAPRGSHHLSIGPTARESSAARSKPSVPRRRRDSTPRRQQSRRAP